MRRALYFLLTPLASLPVGLVADWPHWQWALLVTAFICLICWLPVGMISVLVAEPGLRGSNSQLRGRIAALEQELREQRPPLYPPRFVCDHAVTVRAKLPVT